MSGRGRVHIRQADRSHAGRIHALITASLDEGRLLPRSFDDIVAHAGRFVIATRGRRIVGCAELAPLGPHVAEVRSLVVAAGARGSGLGARLVDEIARQARRAGFERLSAFTHAPRYFSRMGFSIVPHRWVPEKIATDCVGCAEFRRCGQLAMVMALDTAVDAVDSDRMAVRAL
jgi:amino-acid N-acetyltransferase